MTAPRPTVSACILAHSTRAGLERLLLELGGLVDEVVVGVDAASRDGTHDLASHHADVVFRFEHVGPPVRARRLPLRHATGDWILAMDEDEGLDAAFEPLLPALLADARYSHYWFPRKWIVEREPLTYVHAAPWFPDWQLRLFRNDPARVWHTGRVHTGYRVMGPGRQEERTAILHYEPVTRTREERAAKIALYQAQGRGEDFYLAPGRVERRSVAPGPARGGPAHPGGRLGRVLPGVEPVPEVPPAPPWRAVLKAKMPPAAESGAPVLAEIVARNTGALAWDTSGSGWPGVRLAYHLRRKDGSVVQWDGERSGLPGVVEPGEEARLLVTLRAPSEPGSYLVEWDLVSEGECWFGDRGGRTARSLLHVTPPGDRFAASSRF